MADVEGAVVRAFCEVFDRVEAVRGAVNPTRKTEALS
jgi:hypothetical protein